MACYDWDIGNFVTDGGFGPSPHLAKEFGISRETLYQYLKID